MPGQPIGCAAMFNGNGQVEEGTPVFTIYESRSVWASSSTRVITKDSINTFVQYTRFFSYGLIAAVITI